ncbi:MAG: HlyD family efflux transporter periplasmic adaptor subunit [Terricaulis sp.]
MSTIRMKVAIAPLAIALAFGLAGCGGDHAEGEGPGGEAGHAEGETEHAEEGGEHITIPVASAEASGIGVATAGPGPVHETLNLTGRIMLQAAARAEIHAPYPGPVRAVTHNIGDQVQRGQTLARVESAESLQTYSIVTPISGVVLERQTNIGDVTSEEPLFVVGDLTRLQVELNVPTRDIGRVAPNQTVIVTSLDGVARLEARIASVLPMADSHSQTLIARAPITASAHSPLRPGMAIRGAVVLGEQDAAIAVTNDAVQTVEGRDVVFVRTSAETYEIRPVALGRRGATTLEILSGLNPGEIYVSENAFLVKAEIGKGSASHDH